jgi:protein-S-isoprenylcysteine O-methyltransferase Ste14
MKKRIHDGLLKQAGREYQPRQRLMALAFEAVFFLFILPFLLIRLGAAVDRWMGWQAIWHPPFNAVLGGLAMLGGWLFAMWSIYIQFTIGRGTPVPLMATQKLIIQPPYTYCRNPMALGTFVALLGLAAVVGSIGACLAVLAFAALLLTYIRLGEEQEMVSRFGQEYLDYRERTPFLIPRWRR